MLVLPLVSIGVTLWLFFFLLQLPYTLHCVQCPTRVLLTACLSWALRMSTVQFLCSCQLESFVLCKQYTFRLYCTSGVGTDPRSCRSVVYTHQEPAADSGLFELLYGLFSSSFSRKDGSKCIFYARTNLKSLVSFILPATQHRSVPLP